MTSPQTSPSGEIVRLEWVVLGPRAQGRSYGVLRAQGGRRLGEAVTARLNDLALSIAAWAKRGGEPFAALIPVDEAGGHWLLMRCAHLGQAELGAVAIAVGAVLATGDLARLGGLPHRLLPLIPRPDARSIEAEPVEVDPARLAPAGDARGLSAYAEALDEGPLRVEVDDDRMAEPLLRLLLEGVTRQRAQPSWATSNALTRSGRFDPALIELVVAPPGEAARREGETWRRFAGGRFLEPPTPLGAPRAVWGRLFQADRKALTDLQGDVAALAAMEGARWETAYAALDPVDVVRLCLGAAFARLEDAEPAFQLLRVAAVRAHGLTDLAMRQAACRGIALAFEDMVGPASAPAAADWIARYVAIADELLTEAPPAMAARLALDHGALPRLEPALIEGLARQGLSTIFAAATCRAVIAGLGRDPQRMAPLLSALAEAAGQSGRLEAAQVELIGEATQFAGGWPAGAAGEAARDALLRSLEASLALRDCNDLGRLPAGRIAALVAGRKARGPISQRGAILDRCGEAIDSSATAPGALVAAMSIALEAIELGRGLSR